MDRSYFERLHIEETRRSSWRMLDEALRSRSSTSPMRRLRRGVGRALISAGVRLAAEPGTPGSASISTQPCP